MLWMLMTLEAWKSRIAWKHLCLGAVLRSEESIPLKARLHVATRGNASRHFNLETSGRPRVQCLSWHWAKAVPLSRHFCHQLRGSLVESKALCTAESQRATLVASTHLPQLAQSNRPCRLN